jgi:hypothetical protein
MGMSLDAYVFYGLPIGNDDDGAPWQPEYDDYDDWLAALYGWDGEGWSWEFMRGLPVEVIVGGTDGYAIYAVAAKGSVQNAYYEAKRLEWKPGTQWQWDEALADFRKRAGVEDTPGWYALPSYM